MPCPELMWPRSFVVGVSLLTGIAVRFHVSLAEGRRSRSCPFPGDVFKLFLPPVAELCAARCVMVLSLHRGSAEFSL